MSEKQRPPRLKKTGLQADLIEQQSVREAEIQALQEGGYESTLGAVAGRGLSPKVVIPLGLLLVLAVAVSVLMSIRGKDENPVRTEGMITSRAGAGEKEAGIDESKVSNLSDEEVARAFLGAGSWEERRRYVRDVDKLHGQLETYPEEVKTFPIPVARLRPMGAVMPDGMVRYERFAVRMPAGGQRFLCVVQTVEGGRVDYEAFARYSTVSWDQLMEGEAATEVRVMVEKDTYFNHSFRDDTKLACFKLTSPDWPKTVWGYAPSESITARLLSGLVARRPQRVTLALRSEQDSHVRSQFVISRVVINGWVRTPLDPEASLRMRLEE